MGTALRSPCQCCNFAGRAYGFGSFGKEVVKVHACHVGLDGCSLLTAAA